MKLARVSYLNIERLRRRALWMEECFEKYGVPVSVRNRFIGVDAADYTDVHSLVDDSLARGVSVLASVRGASWLEKGTTAFVCGRYQQLASIAEMPEGTCALVLYDDALLMRPYADYERLASELPDFDIVQLSQWDYSREFVEDKSLSAELRAWMSERATLVTLLPGLTQCVERADFAHGTRYPGDHAWLLSPAGARRCLEQMEAHPFSFLENVIVEKNTEWRILSPLPPRTLCWIWRVHEGSYRENLNKEG